MSPNAHAELVQRHRAPGKKGTKGSTEEGPYKIASRAYLEIFLLAFPREQAAFHQGDNTCGKQNHSGFLGVTQH